MKRITQLDFEELNFKEAWDHIQALQTELDRLERVGHDMVERIIRVEGRGGNSLEAYYQDGRSQVFDFADGEWAPRRVHKTRERTHQEKVHELMKKLTVDPVFQSVNKEFVDDLCRAAGISLTVTEE